VFVLFVIRVRGPLPPAGSGVVIVRPDERATRPAPTVTPPAVLPRVPILRFAPADTARHPEFAPVTKAIPVLTLPQPHGQVTPGRDHAEQFAVHVPAQLPAPGRALVLEIGEVPEREFTARVQPVHAPGLVDGHVAVHPQVGASHR